MTVGSVNMKDVGDTDNTAAGGMERVAMLDWIEENGVKKQRLRVRL